MKTEIDDSIMIKKWQIDNDKLPMVSKNPEVSMATRSHYGDWVGKRPINIDKRVTSMTRDDIFSMLRDYFTGKFEVPTEKITREANLFKDLGLDSIDALDMIAMLESKLSINVEEDDLKKITTVNDIIEYIHTAVQAEA